MEMIEETFFHVYGLFLYKQSVPKCRDVLSGIQRSGDFHVSIEVNVLGQ